ncbi:hypothetical protein AURDEDRAFT_109858 [Auricularia subglabra TFB-10046 SS5]|nr:hypothetical protein AURDEDRAFT_109858 [Auricularia subglabra TFB-10046 SS5]
MQPKTLFAVVAPLVAASAVRAAAFPQETGVAGAAKRGNPLDDVTSAINDGVGKATSAIDDAIHWGSSVLSDGVTVLTDGAGKVLTVAEKGAEGLVTTIEGKIFTVVTDNLAPTQTGNPGNGAASLQFSPLLAVALAAVAGVAMV